MPLPVKPSVAPKQRTALCHPSSDGESVQSNGRKGFPHI